MGDVTFGYVYDFGYGRGVDGRARRGAFLDGGSAVQRPKETIEILSFEGTTTPAIAERSWPSSGVAERLRVMGSLALSLCHLAAGRVDGVVSLKAARSVDIAAAQLLVRECGLAIELFEDPPFAARRSISARARARRSGVAELARLAALASVAGGAAACGAGSARRCRTRSAGRDVTSCHPVQMPAR